MATGSLRPALLALAALAGAMCVAFPAYLLLLPRAGVVMYVSDDAYYYFNVARHLAAGDGLTADGVTRTTGFHPLYALLLAGWHRLARPSLDAFVDHVIVLNAAAHLAAAWLLAAAVTQWWGRRAGLLAGLVWLANPHVVKIVATQLEGGIYALVLAAWLWTLVRALDSAAQRGRLTLNALVPLSVLGGLLLLARTDSVPIVLAGAGLVWLASRQSVLRRTVWVGLALTTSLAFLAAWCAYCAVQTGHALPGSATIKTLWRQGMVAEAGWGAWAWMTVQEWGEYLLESFLKVPPLKWVVSGAPLALAVAVAMRARVAWWLWHGLWIVPALMGLAYAGMIDRIRTWYYVPALMGLTVIAAASAVALVQGVRLNRIQRLARRCLPLIAWGVVLESAALFVHDVVKPRSRDQYLAVWAAEWLEQNVEPGTRLGCWHSGIVQYYTPRLTIINLDGLANNDIIDVLRGRTTMNEYWDRMGIEIVLGRPRHKMGGYLTQWDGKRLQRWGPREAGDLIRRIVPAAPDESGPS